MARKRVIFIGNNVEIEAYGKRYDALLNVIGKIPKGNHRNPTSIIELIQANGLIFKKR